MPFESFPQTTLATNTDSNASKTSRSISTNILSTATSSAAAKPTRSRLGGARASFDLQMNSCTEAGSELGNVCDTPAKEEAPLPGTLNPYHDGRIRTAVPSKLKGRTIVNQGNFSVLQIQAQKPEMTARDLAAKLTSERTAAAAKLASTQGYCHPKRLRPQSTTTSPASVPVLVSHPQNLSQPRSQLPPVVPPAPKQSSLPRDITPPACQHKPLKEQLAAAGAADTVLNINTLQMDGAFPESDDIHGISRGHSRQLFVSDTTLEGITEQADGPVPGRDPPTQDVSVEVLDGSVTAADAQETNTEHTTKAAEIMGEANEEQTGEIAVALQEANAGHTTKPGSKSQPLSPAVVKSEQARILALFRYAQPRFIVDQLAKAVARFGAMPDVPLTDTRLFAQSASNHDPGDLFISWLSEIFPAIPLESDKMKKLPTGRPRGRPKGSITKRNKQTTAMRNMSATVVPRPLEPHKDTSAESALIRDGPNNPQQALASTQGPNVLLAPAPTAQSLTATIVPTLRGQEDMPPQPIADISSRTVAIPRMRPIFPSTAPAAQGPASKPTPVQRKKPPTGRPRGRPPGSKNKSKSISNMQSKKASQQDSQPGNSNYLVPQSQTWAKDAYLSRTVDLTSPRNSAKSGCDPVPPQQPNSGSTDTTESIGVHPNQVATSIAQADAPDSLSSSGERITEVDVEVSIISQRPPLCAIRDRDSAPFIAFNKRRTSQQASPREDPGSILSQASNQTTLPANSFVRAQQVKRRRLSQEIEQRDHINRRTSPDPVVVKPTAFTECATSAGLSSASSNYGSQELSGVFEGNSSVGSQSTRSGSSQYVSRHQNQAWDIQHFYQDNSLNKQRQ